MFGLADGKVEDKNEGILAGDYTRKVEGNETAYLVTDGQGAEIEPQVQRINWDPVQAEKGGFKHFMLKEIYEQPRAVRDTTQGRVSLDTGRVFLDTMAIDRAEFGRFIAGEQVRWKAVIARAGIKPD